MKNILFSALAFLFCTVGVLQAQERVEFKSRNGSKEWLKVENSASVPHDKMILQLKEHLALWN